jgi:hypothetical protein
VRFVFVAEESNPDTRLIRGLPDVVFDMLEICLILLISLALGCLGLPFSRWSDWSQLAGVMFERRCRRHGATPVWPPLRRGKAGPLTLTGAGGTELLRNHWRLWAWCGLAPCRLTLYRSGTGTPTLSRQPLR